MTSVAGIALATPLSRNTAISRRKAGVRQGSSQAPGSAGAPACSSRSGAARNGAPDSAQIATTSRPMQVATITGTPASAGSTLAASTPASDRPSRQPVMRACAVAPPPSRAPQAWCSTPSAL